MKVLVFNCRKVLEINCRKLLVFTCFLQLLDGPDDIMGTISGGDGQIDGTDMEKLMEAMNIIKQQGDATDLYMQF